MAMGGCSECREWERKYEAVEKEFRYVKNLANKGVIEHEDLFSKYEENKRQYDELCQTLEQKDRDIEKLRNIIQPFVADFRELEVKAEIQTALRQDAENYARKAHKQYMDIKRKSLNMCQKFQLSAASIDVDIDAEPEAEVDRSVAALQERIEDLEETVEDLASQLDRCKEERDDAICNGKTYEDECNSLKRQKAEVGEELTNYQKMTDSFKRVSFLALEEITELTKKYDIEKTFREEALQLAQGLQKEKKIIQHQSQAVMASAFSDVKLRNALLQVEDKTRENETMRGDYDKKIRELEKKCSESLTQEKIAHLERCIEVNELEIERLNKSISEQKKKIETMDHDKRCLQERLDMSNKMNLGAAPPPPPPPPPIKAPVKFTLFGHKKKVQAGAAAVDAKKKVAVKGNENYDKALEELMKRIKERAQKEEGRSTSLDALVNKDKKRNSRVAEINNVLHSLGPSKHPTRSRPVVAQEKTEVMTDFEKKMSQRKKISDAGLVHGVEN
ncbi:shootin-1-like [Lineus longissimus]|uniref:shootin-1-like n=1 Tax=Lineus longissimus TaxID=88925 RepID=UPI002B4E9A07